METIREQFDRKTGVYGHNDKFRTVIRRTLRNGLGLDQRRAQEWAEIADYWVDLKVMQGVWKALKSGNPWAMAAGAGVAYADRRQIYRRARFALEPEQIKKSVIDKTLRFLGRRLNIPEALLP
jgi:hypothetical protein